jgi:hypothetical protein
VYKKVTPGMPKANAKQPAKGKAKQGCTNSNTWHAMGQCQGKKPAKGKAKQGCTNSNTRHAIGQFQGKNNQ